MAMRQTLIVDASYNHHTNVTGIGIVIHETDRPKRNGAVIDKIGESYSGIPPGSGELLAVYRALEIGVERGFATVRIRSDYNQMRKALKKSYARRTSFDRSDLYGATLRLTAHFDVVKFGYKPKRKNHMAHSIGRTAAREVPPVHRPDLVEMCVRGSRRGVGSCASGSIRVSTCPTAARAAPCAAGRGSFGRDARASGGASHGKVSRR